MHLIVCLYKIKLSQLYESSNNKPHVGECYNKSQAILMCANELHINTQMHLYFVIGQPLVVR